MRQQIRLSSLIIARTKAQHAMSPNLVNQTGGWYEASPFAADQSPNRKCCQPSPAPSPGGGRRERLAHACRTCDAHNRKFPNLGRRFHATVPRSSGSSSRPSTIAAPRPYCSGLFLCFDPIAAKACLRISPYLRQSRRPRSGQDWPSHARQLRLNHSSRWTAGRRNRCCKSARSNDLDSCG